MSFLSHSIILLDFYGTFKTLIYYNSELKAVLGCQTGHALKGAKTRPRVLVSVTLLLIYKRCRGGERST